jgi:hypothetical protein
MGAIVPRAIEGEHQIDYDPAGWREGYLWVAMESSILEYILMLAVVAMTRGRRIAAGECLQQATRLRREFR